MATAGNERYLRYLLLTGEGGSLILRSILDRETAKSTRPLDELLQAERLPLTKRCKSDDPHLKKLFPSVGNLDIGTWDISLLAKVILQLFKTRLTKDEISDISSLRELRNALSHAASFSKDEDEYDVDRQRMTSLLIRLSNGLDRPVHDKCQNLIKSCDSGPIDISGAIERVKEISRYDEIFAERLNTLIEKVADISRKVDTVLVGVEDVKALLQELVQENARAHSFYVLGSKMMLKGPDARLTDLGEKAIERVFRTALLRAGGDRDISKLTTEVMRILDDIENCNNVEINEIERLCVKMSMKCGTFRGLLELLEYLQSDVFKKRLLGLVQAVEEMYGGVFHITFEIERDSLYEIQYSLEPTIDDVETKLQEENEKLLDEIVDTCEYIDDEDSNHVILLIGRIGAGKSSLINTLHKVLTGKYFIIAKQGSGVTQSVTGELIRYDNLGVKVKSLENIPDVHRRQKMEKIFKKLPTIVDFAGLGNVKTPELSEILELLIGGNLPSGTAMTALETCQKDFEVGALKRIFPDRNPDLKVSKIIFMHSCTDEFPNKLIECISGVLKTFLPSKFHLEYKPDIFLLTSKFDLVKDLSLHSIHASSEAVISLEEYEKVEKDLAKEWNISGKSFRWISFTDSINTQSAYVENIALKLLKCLLQPGIPRQQPPAYELGTWKRLKLKAFKMVGQVKRFLSQEIQLKMTPAVLVAIVLCVIAVVLAFWLYK